MAPQGERDSLGAGQNVKQPLRWPLVNRLQVRDNNLPLQKDARLINCFAEYDPEDNEYWIYKRPGLSPQPFYTIDPTAAGIGLGMYNEVGGGFIFSVASTPVFAGSLFAGATNIGSVNATGGQYWWVTLGPAGQPQRECVLANRLNGYIVSFTTGPFGFFVPFMTPITDPNFPLNRVPGLVNIDGTVYTMDTSGNIWGSATVNSAATWDPLNQIKANSEADLGVAIFKQLNYLVALKQLTTQVFYDAANPPPGSALGPVPDAQIGVGCLSGYTVQCIDDTAVWVGSNVALAPQVIQMDNITPKVVSTPPVERILNEVKWFDPSFDVQSWILKINGHRLYGLTIVQLNLTLVYDLDQQLWYIWTDSNGNYWPISAMASTDIQTGVPGNSFPARHLVQRADGSIYELDGSDTYPNDYGNLFPVDIYTPNVGFGTVRRKFLKGMYFRADRTPNSFLQARFSDDDYSSWSNFRTIDLSKKKPRMMNCGTFSSRRAYHFRHQCNTSFRIKTGELAMHVGTL